VVLGAANLAGEMLHAGFVDTLGRAEHLAAIAGYEAAHPPGDGDAPRPATQHPFASILRALLAPCASQITELSSATGRSASSSALEAREFRDLSRAATVDALL